MSNASEKDNKKDEVPINRSVRSVAAHDLDKPDTVNFDLGSPISPLRSSRSGGAVSYATAFTNTSSSSGSSGSVSGTAVVRRSETTGKKSHSGELSGSTASSAGPRNSRPGHRRSGSGPLIYSGGGGGGGASTANSPTGNAAVLPAGNICPSGKVRSTGMMPRIAPRSDVLGSGTTNYGHGSIVRGTAGLPAARNVESGVIGRKGIDSSDPEEVKRAGNEQYRRGQFADALRMYDRAITMCPESAACRSNRAAALMALGRLGEAVRECEEAVRLDPAYGRAHHRLASLYLRLGQIENAKKHLYFTGELPDPMESQKLQTIEKHIGGSVEARKIGDWASLLRESQAGIATGADSSLLLLASRAEALLQLRQLEEADAVMSNALKLETLAHTASHPDMYGFRCNSYVYAVRAQLEMALGRFDNAELAVERARGLDPANSEVVNLLRIVKLVSRARKFGNDFFNSGKFTDACLAYGEGLSSDPCNAVLYCNRAACHSKLGQWQKAVDDCNRALKFHPNYMKALLRRASSYEKLEKWDEAVRDYEALRKELPHVKEVAEALFHAQIALKNSLGEAVSNLTFGGEVEKILDAEQFRTAISAPGVSIVYFMAPQNHQCIQISPFVDTLCQRYPSLIFRKVDVTENRAVADMEKVKIVPTIKFYKDGTKLKEMVCPSQQVLEYSVRHYVL